MAILKIKRLIEDLETNSSRVLTSMTKLASTASNAGVASTAKYAGTSAIAGTSSFLGTSLDGINNRVLGGTAGTGYVPVLAGCAIGATSGFKTTYEVGVVRKGVVTNVLITDNMYFPAQGTMGTNTVAKFLICSTAGTGAQIKGPGNIVDKGAYASATLAAAACKVPDLPEGECALGYVTLNAPAATVLVLTAAATTTPAGALGYAIGGGGTAGTAAYVDLVSMPYDT
jgi:hypothetical protein